MNRQINSLFEEYYREHNFSGAGFVKIGNEEIYSNAYGYAHRGFKVPNTVGTMFDTASVTKLFTAVAILQLVDKNLLKLEDKITEVIDLEGTKIPKDVTIAHLLTHTSGIADDADEVAGEKYEDLFINKPNYSIRKCIDFIPQFAYKEPNFKAGSDVRYNNCAFVLLGLAIEKATSQVYQEYVRKNIFSACGMNNTSFASKDDAEVEVAEGYCCIQEDKNGSDKWIKNIYLFPPVGTADGGAFTSVGDLDIFIRSLKTGKLLSQKMTKEIFKPQTSIEEKYEGVKIRNGFGFHFLYNMDDVLIRIHKEGSNAGVAAMFAYYPSIDTTSIILANQTCNVWKLHYEIEKIILKGN